MTKFYIAAIFAAFIFCAYLAGGRIADARCRAEIAINQNRTTVAAVDKIIETKGRVNAETYNAGVGDIRGRLRAKYTIAD